MSVGVANSEFYTEGSTFTKFFCMFAVKPSMSTVTSGTLYGATCTVAKSKVTSEENIRSAKEHIYKAFKKKRHRKKLMKKVKKIADWSIYNVIYDSS